MRILPNRNRTRTTVRTNSFNSSINNVMLLARIRFYVTRANRNRVLSVVVVRMILTIRRICANRLIPNYRSQEENPRSPNAPLPTNRTTCNDNDLNRPKAIAKDKVSGGSMVLRPKLASRTNRQQFVWKIRTRLKYVLLNSRNYGNVSVIGVVNDSTRMVTIAIVTKGTIFRNFHRRIVVWIDVRNRTLLIRSIPNSFLSVFVESNSFAPPSVTNSFVPFAHFRVLSTSFQCHPGHPSSYEDYDN